MYWLPLFFILLLTACVDKQGRCHFLPYKLDIVQGNVLSQDQLDQLYVGMTRAQVRDLLGTPMLADSIHEDRWIYHHMMACGGRMLEQKNIILYFSGDLLQRAESISPKKSIPDILLLKSGASSTTR